MPVDDRKSGLQAGEQQERLDPKRRSTLGKPNVNGAKDGAPAVPGETRFDSSGSPPSVLDSVQTGALKRWSAERCDLTVYLRNSIRQRGVLVDWDRFMIMLDVGGGVVERIEKKAILSIIPSRVEK